MIIACHLLVGATIATRVSNPFLGLPFAFLSHYLLDFIPHQEYSTSPKYPTRGGWKKWLPTFLKIVLDFSLGLLILLIISQNKTLALAGGFFGILGDFDNVVLLFPSLLRFKHLKKHIDFHLKYFHFLGNKKIPLFFRILTQAITIIIAIYFLK